ncbi:MAG: TetR/AcrR family transcriptional regulator [Bacilli bacterium]|nr:TetR/AcrR family transcriptional regulator [Bacilli bacterium]
MKYDTSKPMTKNAKRTLGSFCIALNELLKTDGFDNISVNKICEKAGYPRATFYNYFDDKYDLLEFFWTHIINMKVLVNLPEKIEPDNFMRNVYDKVYEFGVENQENCRAIFYKNKGENYFMNSLRYNLRDFVYKFYQKYEKDMPKGDLPDDLRREHFVDVVALVLNYRFIKGKNWDREETYRYFRALLKE